jgi:hypothetical protein
LYSFLSPCTEDWCLASSTSCRREERFLNFFEEQNGDIPKNLEVISDNSNIVGIHANSNDEHKVDDAEDNPKYDSIVVI